MTNSTNSNIDTIKQAQTDMCKAYADGSIGILVSGFVWLTSAMVIYQVGPKQGIWALLFGGMLIYPLSEIIKKAIGINTTHAKGNPLGNLALEGTLFMIMCLPLAFFLSLQHPEWFFLAMLMIIGGRYLTFATIYGKKHYWILGAALGIASYLLYNFKTLPFTCAITGSSIEIIFGVFMFINFRKSTR